MHVLCNNASGHNDPGLSIFRKFFDEYRLLFKFRLLWMIFDALSIGAVTDAIK